MRASVFIAVSVTIGLAATTPAIAEAKKKQQPVPRSARGTVIQPTRTIIHHPDGTTTVITVARRSYLDPGTEVPVGYPSREDYAFPPGGDPGQPYWYYGPDQHGVGGRPLAPWFRLPGLNPPNGPTE
jgi:hypothetical protein